jgi:mannosyl-3-phosphoglycerate phosphatase
VRLIVTDLDGTLIDHHTYSADAARPALDAARLAGVPIVPCSSKTLAEMRALATRLSLAPAPLIVENGGAIWFPDTWPAVPDGAVIDAAGGRILVLGSPAAVLRSRLEPVAAAAGVEVRGFSRMTDAEVAERTGLPLELAALARQRQFSEPFVCLSGTADPARLDAVARVAGARVTRGGRFFHLTGVIDKGAAVRIVRGTCAAGVRTLGLGDAPNDLPLLRAVDDAVIVPQPERGPHPDLVAALPAARHAPAAGPAGWNVVVLAWLDSATAPW